MIDFTTRSDEELIAFFQTKPAHVCGRFRPVQLKKYVAVHPKVTPGFRLLKASLALLLIMLFGKPASSQSSPAKNKTEQAILDNTKKERKVPHAAEYTVRGVVLSPEDDSPLPGVSIVLKGSAIGTASDFEGRFEFPKKLTEGDVLSFSFIGFRTTEYTVRSKPDDLIEIQMNLDMEIMGEVAITGLYEPKPSPFKKLWCRVKGLF